MKRTILWGVLLLLLVFTLACSAFAFSDQDKIHNENAVAIMTDIGLFGGYDDGTFRPLNNIRRREAAKLMALICEEEPKAETPCTFSDVPRGDWASGYIAYCVNRNIVSGYGNAFRPNGYVTGREFAKMLLGCLGYDGRNYSGAGWAQQVDRDANAIGIYNGFSADPGNYLSRDNACLLIYNALQCYAVAGTDESGKILYHLDDLMNPRTYMEYRFSMTRYTGVVTGNEYADLTTANHALEQGRTKLAGHREFSVSTPVEFLGRTAEIYTTRVQDGNQITLKVVGKPALVTSEILFSTNSFDFFADSIRIGNYTFSADAEYYLNGNRVSEGFGSQLGNDYTITCLDRNDDNVIDVVLAYDYVVGQVQVGSPLTVVAGGKSVRARSMAEKEYTSGTVCRCIFMGGTCWIAED